MRNSRALADLRRTALLTAPGFIGLVVTTGLVTGRLGGLADADAARFVLFLQVELLCVGVARLGLEQLVLSRAAALEDPRALAFARPLFRVSVPLAALGAALLGSALGGRIGLALLIAAPFDIFTSVVAAFELGCRRYIVPIANSWLNYPVFLLLLVTPIPGVDTSRLGWVLTLFCATSVGRGLINAVLYWRNERSVRGRERVRISAGATAAAGVVNVATTVMQRLDSVVLVVFASRFASIAVLGYLVAARLLDSSYSLSSVAGSVLYVSDPDGSSSSARRTRVALIAGAWLACWLAGAALLAVLARNGAAGSWPVLLLAAFGAAGYLATVRIVLADMAASRTARLTRRALGYLAVHATFAVAAIAAASPVPMLVAPLACGAWSLRSIVRPAPEPQTVPVDPDPVESGPEDSEGPEDAGGPEGADAVVAPTSERGSSGSGRRREPTDRGVTAPGATRSTSRSRVAPGARPRSTMARRGTARGRPRARPRPPAGTRVTAPRADGGTA
ncbi:MAG: hypothetical protein IT196_26645 [Acidimicrobiales bacterium]|nr:hypothetical protein [Acidimicrobiales bacterium]